MSNGEMRSNPMKLLNMKALKKAVIFAVLNPPRMSRIPATTAKILKLEE
jgi:hypothetical protein